MKILPQLIIVGLTTLIIVSCAEPDKTVITQEQEVTVDEIKELAIKNLLRDSLGLADSVEVIMSYLEMPKNTTLPLHYHPGEEFVYAIEGSGELTLDGVTSTVSAGDVVKIPLEKVHSYSTKNESSKLIVFRVHKQGQPDRILVED